MMTDEIPLMLEREAGLSDHYPQVAVGFGLLPMQDSGKSEKAGHAVFVDKEFCKIVVPGDKQSVYCQPATEQHKLRFPKAYATFKSRESTSIEGFRIEEWPVVTRGTALTLKAMHIHTVEALAEVSDSNLANLGPQGRELRAKAQAFVKQAKDSAAVHKMAKREEELNSTIKALQDQITDLANRVPQDAETKPRKAKAA